MASGVIFLSLLFVGHTTGLRAQLASCHSKFVGNIWYNGTMPLHFDQYFNQLTPENATKWGSVQGGGSNSWNWGDATSMYNYCKSHSIPFKFHTLVWGNQNPSWVNNASNKAAAVENWIKEAARTFPNCDFVDVVNECLPNHAQPSWLGSIGGTNGLYGTGWDWVVWSFEKARQYFPNSKLLINDYNILNNSWNNDLDVLCQIVNILKNRGLIDGIGLQSHGLASTPGADVTSRLNRITSQCPGMPIYISEFDLDIADDNQQKNKLAELFPILWNNSAVKGITFWGYVQGHTWISNSHLIRSDGSERPSMVWLKDYLKCGSCTPTAITPNVQVNGGTWQQTSSVTVASGATVVLGPQPDSGGSWSWSGCGTSGTSREQTVTPTSSCTATATYTNSCGAQSTQNFNITVGGSSSDIVDGGVYRITPRNGGKAVDVSGCGTADGTNVQNWSWLNNDCQKWQFTALSGGYWKISPVYATSKALDVSGVSSSDGANVQIWNYGGGNNQQWQVSNLGNGYYQIIARHSGKCLDLSNGSTADGANIQQWACSSSNTNQHFTFTSLKSAEGGLTEDLTEYKLYPSLVDNNLNITFRGQDHVNVKIYNDMGALVLSTNLSGTAKTIDVSNLASGIYFIRLEGDKRIITDRFIKK